MIAILVSGCAGAGPGFGNDGETVTGLKLRPDQLGNFGVPLHFTGLRPGRLTSASVEKVPDAIEVVEIRAFRPREFGNGIGAARGDLVNEQNLRAYDLEDVRLDPDRPDDWQLLVTMRSREVGRHTTMGIVLNYTIGGKRGTQLLPAGFALRVLDCTNERDRQEAQTVCSRAPEKSLSLKR